MNATHEPPPPLFLFSFVLHQFRFHTLVIINKQKLITSTPAPLSLSRNKKRDVRPLPEKQQYKA